MGRNLRPLFDIMGGRYGFLQHYLVYEAVSLHMCVLPYKCRKILEMLLQPMKLCDIMGGQDVSWMQKASVVKTLKVNNK